MPSDTSKPRRTKGKKQPPKPRRWPVVLAAAAFLLALAGAAAWWFWPQADSSEVADQAATSAEGKLPVEPSPPLADVPADQHVLVELRRWTAENVTGQALCLAPDGTWAVLRDQPDGCSLWNLDTLERRRRFQAEKHLVQALAVSNDGRYLLTGGTDATARVWDVATGEEKHQIKLGSTKTTRRGDPVTAVVGRAALAPDGSRAMLVCADDTVREWNVGSASEPIVVRGSTRGWTPVAYAPDGSRGAHDAMGRIAWRPSGESWVGHRAALSQLAFSPDGELLLSTGLDYVGRLWRVRDGVELVQVRGIGAGGTAAAFANEGRTILVAGGYDGWIAAFDVATGRLQRRWRGKWLHINAACFAANGKTVLICADEGSMCLCRLPTVP